jgi:hypothetical protein
VNEDDKRNKIILSPDGVRNAKGRYVTGTHGKPGRPIGSRSKFSEAMVADFLADWHEHGTDVLARVQMQEPATYLRVAAVLIPKEMKVEVDHRAGPLNRAEVQMMRKLIDMIQANVPQGSDPAEVFAVLEDALRAHFARPIDQ